jgi:hypothetical protein
MAATDFENTTVSSNSNPCLFPQHKLSGIYVTPYATMRCTTLSGIELELVGVTVTVIMDHGPWSRMVVYHTFTPYNNDKRVRLHLMSNN